MQRAIEILWKFGKSKGYTDVFPLDEFAKEVSRVRAQHLVRGPQGGSLAAQYLRTVAGRHAEINYRAFLAFNRRHDMEIGLMRLEFMDTSRTTVKTVYWDGDEVDAAAMTIRTVPRPVPSPGELAATIQRRSAQVRLRDGQMQFRRRLELVYGSQCCISGCDVAWVLEAAHIARYVDRTSNHDKNGILLRSDLHSLFDADQVAIHPKTRRIHFGTAARVYHEYDKRHDKDVLLQPQPGYEASAPSIMTLRKRWALFISAQKKAQ